MGGDIIISFSSAVHVHGYFIYSFSIFKGLEITLKLYDESRETDTTKIREEEVRQALKKTKSVKAPGIDEIPAELLYKADSDVAVKELTRLFNGYGMRRGYLTNGKKAPDHA